MGLAPESRRKAAPLHRHNAAALIVQDFHSGPARRVSAAFSKGGKSLPRRSARLKIPAQAFGDKEYFSGAVSSKIADKKHAPPPLGCPKVTGIVYAPSEINASASCHSGVGPPSRSRHWNFGLCERREHGLIVKPRRGTRRTGHVFPEREFGVFAMCRFPHFIDNANGLQEKAAPLIRQTPAKAGDGEPLAG